MIGDSYYFLVQAFIVIIFVSYHFSCVQNVLIYHVFIFIQFKIFF